LLSSDYIEHLADGQPAPLAPTLLAGDTVYTCAIDADGNACSLIQSIYYAFGSAFAVNETGIVLHNRAHYFNLNEHSPNCIAPSKRPSHTLIAAMALRADQPAFVLGTMGADGQPQTLAQVAMRLFGGEHPQDAVSADRFLSGRFILEDPDDVLLVEEGFSAVTQTGLREHGHVVETVPRLDERMGHAHAIAVRPDGSVEAGSDPRSDGAALVLDPKT
jgi:gamma-glutamyltranspeptidase/glutathione hydrolase